MTTGKTIALKQYAWPPRVHTCISVQGTTGPQGSGWVELEPRLMVVVTAANTDTTTVVNRLLPRMVNRPWPRRQEICLAGEMALREMGTDLTFHSVLIPVSSTKLLIISLKCQNRK